MLLIYYVFSSFYSFIRLETYVDSECERAYLRITVAGVVAGGESVGRHFGVDALVVGECEGVEHRAVESQRLDVLAYLAECVAERYVVDFPVVAVLDVVAVELGLYLLA